MGRADIRQCRLESWVMCWSRTLACPSPSASWLSTRTNLQELCQSECRYMVEGMWGEIRKGGRGKEGALSRWRTRRME